MHLEIKTSRTILRLIREEDLDLIAELNINKEVRKFFLDEIFSRKETEKRIKDCIALYKKCGLPYFSILNRISGEFMGRCGFTPFDTDQIEISLLIAKRFWGKGYATEILTALLN